MEGIYYALILPRASFCAYRAIVSKRILSETIYLACISALVSAVIYLLDIWIQIALIFSGILGVLGLLSEKTPGRTEEHQQ